MTSAQYFFLAAIIFVAPKLSHRYVMWLCFVCLMASWLSA